ncbi:hypothetical protein BGZ80_001741 [Entomortierella chlamydospora]|uniref:Transmembrane protein n=1 Tax=Entomortierella chlamydospora TaxID=101097 RepID=A0A9P6N1K1_9FUNG|nr:hypothetical protein BGZ80_001741 [Entomortierella chlamydospora]
MTSLSPICLTSDEVFMYAAVFGYDATENHTEATDANLIIARSNPYPESLKNTNWTVISTSRNYPSEVIESPSDAYTYNCAWNPQTSGFGLLAQRSPGSVAKNASRFNIYIPEHGSSALSTSSEAISSSQQVLSGRNILLPIESDNTEARSWLQVYMDHSVNQMSFSYLGKNLEFTEQPQVQWSMDTIKTGSNHVLAHMNNTLYALGVANNTYIMSFIPLNATVGPSLSPAIVQSITTSIDGQACDISDERTVMHADEGSVYIMCYWSSQTSSTGPLYRIYTFNGTDVTNLGTIPVPAANEAFQFAPVPTINTNDSNTTSPNAPWIYTFSSFINGFSLNLTNNSLSYDLSDTSPFYTDRAYFHDSFGIHASHQPKDSVSTKSIAITFTVLSALCSIIVVAILLSRRKRKSLPEHSEEHELEASSGCVPVDDSYPSIYPSDTNDELPSYAAATAPSSRAQRD